MLLPTFYWDKFSLQIISDCNPHDKELFNYQIALLCILIRLKRWYLTQKLTIDFRDPAAFHELQHRNYGLHPPIFFQSGHLQTSFLPDIPLIVWKQRSAREQIADSLYLIQLFALSCPYVEVLSENNETLALGKVQIECGIATLPSRCHTLACGDA